MSISYDYYPAVLYALDRIGMGRTKTGACDDANITIAIFNTYVNRHTELQEQLEEMTQRSHDAMVDALLEIDNHKIYGQSDPKMAKVISDNIKFVVGKRDAKRFGDRVQVDVNVTADKAIIAALTGGRQRALAHMSDAQFIDVTPVVLTEDEAIEAEIFGNTLQG